MNWDYLVMWLLMGRAVVGFILFLGNPKKREEFKNGMLAINRALETRLARNTMGTLLVAFTVSGLTYALMVYTLLLAKGEFYNGLMAFALMATATIGYAFFNYRLFFK